MTTKWVRYESLAEGSQKRAVIDCLGMPYRFRGDYLRSFTAQILALRNPGRRHILELTALPFRDLVAQASTAFGNVDESKNEVIKALDRIIGSLAVSQLKEAMATVISQELKKMYDGMSGEDGDRTPEQHFCFPITGEVKGTVFRLDLNFIAFKPETESIERACGKIILFFGLVFIVPSSFATSRRDVRRAVEISYRVKGRQATGLVDIFCGPLEENAVDQTEADDPTGAVADHLGLLRMCSSSGFFGNVDVSGAEPQSLRPEGTYFLAVPKGTASEIVEQAKSWFTSAVLAKSTDSFKLDFREVGNTGSRLEIDVWSNSPSSGSGDVEPQLIGGLIASAGKMLVKHVAAPLVVHHFGKV